MAEGDDALFAEVQRDADAFNAFLRGERKTCKPDAPKTGTARDMDDEAHEERAAP